MALCDPPDPIAPQTRATEIESRGRADVAAPPGAKKRTIDHDILKELGAAQCTLAEAAAALKISEDALAKAMTPRSKARLAFEEGRAAGLAGLRRAQLKLAETNASVAIHLGRVYLGQTERRGGDTSGSNAVATEVATVAQHVRERLAALVFEANRLRHRAADSDCGDTGLAGG